MYIADVVVWLGICVVVVLLASYILKKSNTDALFWKKLVLSLAVATVFPFMVHYGIKTFVDEPRYDEYVTIDTINRDDSQYKLSIKQREAQQASYYKAKERCATIAFSIWLIAGGLSIIGSILLSIPAANAGFAWGGIFSILSGYVSYFSYMSEAVVFVSSALVLIGFTYFAYRKFGGTEKDVEKE